jgi:hypothetical protein
MKRFLVISLITLLTLGSSSCSSSSDAADACAELEILIDSLETNQVQTLSQFHETVDAILIHARNAAKSDRDFAQLANKIQEFASMWYATAGNSVPTPAEARELELVSNTYCNAN